MTELVCASPRRRAAARAAGLRGLDHVEVGDDQRTLTVFFVGPAPERVRAANVRIKGGPAAPVVRLTRDPEVHRYDDPRRADCMDVRLAAPGDLSAYTLCLAEVDERGRPTGQPMPGFDPRLACLPFSFGVVCPSDLDCAAPAPCPEPVRVEPEIDYLAKDYASFRQLLLDRLTLVMPAWTERHVPDVGIAVVELLAYAGDHLSYLQDAVATEAYLATARQRISVRRHARLVDYAMHEGCNARVLVCLETAADQTVDLARLQLRALRETGGGATPPAVGGPTASPAYEVFEPVVEAGRAAVRLRAARNAIAFHTWGDSECCLPQGATAATLVDGPAGPDRPQALDLQPGDLLVLEEVKGPATGREADADRAHRHPVRLVDVERTVDPLGPGPDGQPVVEVSWDQADALPFALCLSSLREEDCALVEGISVARGNVVLADHGRTLDREPLGAVQEAGHRPCCEAEDHPAEVTPAPASFAPVLGRQPVTWREPTTGTGVPATRLLNQDPRRCLPVVTLRQDGDQLPVGGVEWSPRRDLLGSGPYDGHFVAEIDNDGVCRLRFGDGRHGRRPAARTGFAADYRVGNGPDGNIGADARWAVVVRDSPDGSGGSPGLAARNPMAAAGGVAPESLDEVRALAPVAFRGRLERAVTAEDYAALAAREDVGGGRVQRAAATLRWTGSWHEVLTTVDARGELSADPSLLAQVAGGLDRYRRIGHDLVVAPAEHVSLLAELTVCVLPGYLKGHVKAALLDALSNRVLPSGRLGYFHPDNLSFGTPVTVSGITAAAAQVVGVETVQVTRLERQRQGPDGEIEAGVLRLGPDEVARLDNDPNLPDHGVLLLRVGGGR